MQKPRADPRRIKIHRIYTAPELATGIGVHKNTVRHWRANGLEPVCNGRPALFLGSTVRAFLATRNASRKRPCPPGTFYCFRCRQPRPPALGMVEASCLNASTVNLKALCDMCGTMMHRRVRVTAIAATMPNLTVQFRQADPRLSDRSNPSLNCANPKD